MLNCQKIILIVVTLVCMSSKACAGQSVYPIYALLDANSLYGVINGIAALMNSKMFKYLLSCFGLLGIAWVIVLVAIQRTFKRLFMYIFAVSFFVSFALHSQVSVQVISQLTGETYEVNNVPAILAVPASWMSIIGYEGAKAVDQAYASVGGMKSNLTLTGGTPFSLSNQLIEDATTYQLKDTYLHSSMIHFIADCAVPAIANGKLTMTQLLKSNNIWSLFTHSILNPSLMTVSFGTDDAPVPAGNVLTCPEAYDSIQQILPKAQEKMIASLSKNIMAGLSASLFQDSLEYNAKGSLYNPKPGDYIQQAAILNLLKGPVQKYMASKSQSSLMMQSLAVSQAVEATELSWVTSAEVFAKTMGYIYSALQILIFAVAPILLLFAVFPGAGMVLGKRYFTLLAWFPMTFIMLAICNDLVLSWTHSELSTLFRNYDGLVLGSQALITVKTAKMQAVGAFLVSVTPIISFALVAGLQMPITSILSHSGAATFGSQAGASAATGNASLDQQSHNNVSANKFNTTSAMEIGAMPVEHNVSGGNSSLRANFGGESALLNGAPDMMSHQSQTNVQTSQTTSTSHSIDQGGSVTTDSGFNDGAHVGQDASNSTNTTLGGGVNFGASAKSIGKAMKAAAATAGVAIPLATLDSSASDIAHAKEMSEKAYQADKEGNEVAKQEFLKKSEGFYSKTMHDLSNSFTNMSTRDRVVIGGVIAAGVAASFLTGVGEAAVATAAVGGAGLAAAEGGAMAEGVAVLGGTALRTAAAGEGMVATIGTGLSRATNTVGKLGKNLTKGAGRVAAGLTNAFMMNLQEEERGSLGTRLSTDFGTKSSHTEQERDSYNDSNRVDKQTHVSRSETSVSTYQAPNHHLHNALSVVNPPANSNSSIEQALNTYNADRDHVNHASASVRKDIQALKQKTHAWHAQAKQELASRQGLNQLSKTNLQKNEKDRTVN